ncbi:MAG TPA: glycosyltransferase [Chloroflexota bacterium]|nr:glycosyltransferase [Chloroflexota bacterium]
MRVLFTCMAYTGHVHPIAPFARALAAAGHDVAVATHESLAAQVAAAGLRHLPAGLSRTSPEVLALWREIGDAALGTAAAEAFVMQRDFGGLRPQRMLDDLAVRFADWTPDLVVRDSMELGGALAAERAGLPHAAINILAAGLQPRWRTGIVAPLERLRAANGMPPDPQGAMLSRYLTLHPFPPSFSAVPALPTDRFVRPLPFDRSGSETLPDWVDDLPRRPTVYATLGTAFNDLPGLFEAFVAGLGDAPLNLIVTVGRDGDPAALGPLPANTRVERYIPQSLLLPRCDLVLTHGGSGTVTGALAAGLPLVVVPVAADQPENAARCAALGVGRVVPAAAVTPDAVRDAVRAVLADPSYRRNAARLRDEIAALPAPEVGIALLEALGAGRRRRAA